MSSKADFFIKKTLGDDFLESLQKVELWKPGTRTTIDHEEIKTALHIVPRTVMAILIRELTPMAIGDAKEIEIHGAVLKVTKHERDVYTGTLDQENKVIVDFKYRSIPGVGLVIMSALELYDVNELNEAPQQENTDITEKVQRIIEERLALHDLVGKVVDKKLEQRDAVKALILAKLTDAMSQPAKVEPAMELSELGKSDKTKKSSPLGGFLDSRKDKAKKKANEFSIQIAKGEHYNCQDCGGSVFDGENVTGCICLGDDMNKKIVLQKTEDGVKLRFGKGWDQENIEMLLEMLRRKNG